MSDAAVGAAARAPARRGVRLGLPPGLLTLAWPATVLTAAFAVPSLMLLRVGFAHHDASGLWSGGFTLQAYVQMFSAETGGALLASVEFALACAAICILAGFPLAYAITRMGRRAQVAWLVLLLSTLTLSEVLITFSWQVMLSKRVGLSNVLVWLGWMDEPDSLTPGAGAVVGCLVYLILPFTVLTLYPGLSRLDRSLVEAARTLGASPARAFLTVVIPGSRGSIVSAFILASVLAMGSYVAPLVLGPTQDWTLAILIARTALSGQDMPGAVALAMLLLVVTVALVLLASRASRSSLEKSPL